MVPAINIIVILSSIALLLPVFSGYVLAFAMLVLQCLPIWRAHNRSMAYVSSKQKQLAWFWGQPIIILLVGFAVATVIAGVRDGGGNWHKAIQFLGNSAVKYGLLWLFLVNFILVAVRDFRAVHVLVKCLPWVTGLHFLYCLAQRQYGIDWVHGFHAVLPENRHVYGVFRVSGFTSHPLTIGYQLCFVLAFCFALILSDRPSHREKRLLTLSSTFTWLTILISGSRGPLLVSIALVGWMMIPLLRSKAKSVVVIGVVAVALVGLVFVIPGTIDRFFEAFANIGGDTRLTDLKVYTAAFLDHPIVGLGNLDLSKAISAYYAGFGGDDTIGLAHNMYMQVAAETGLVGFLSFLQWMAAWPRVGRRLEHQQERWSFYGLSLVMILSGITQNSLRDSGVVFALTLVTLVLTVYFSGDASVRDEHESEGPKHRHIESGARA